MSLACTLHDQMKMYLIGNDLNKIIGSKLVNVTIKYAGVIGFNVLYFYNLRNMKLNLRQS